MTKDKPSNTRPDRYPTCERGSVRDPREVIIELAGHDPTRTKRNPCQKQARQMDMLDQGV